MKNHSSGSVAGQGPWRRGVRAYGVLILVVAGLLAFLYFRWTATKVTTREDALPRDFTEIVAMSGVVRVLAAGDSEWREAKVGERLGSGDLVRTDARGSARIRYPNGTEASIRADTIFGVQPTGSNEMEVWMTATSEPGEQGERGGSEAGGRSSLDRAGVGELRPSLRLERIVPFGQSLQLVGYVEPGSRLSVNGEKVEVEGDGSFTHFTNPFPRTAETVAIVLEATNLAGRKSTLTAKHSFRSRAGVK